MRHGRGLALGRPGIGVDVEYGDKWRRGLYRSRNGSFV
jgi:hypothetical protein